MLDEYVSVDAARTQYGVAIVGEGMDLRVDATATRALRNQMRRSA